MDIEDSLQTVREKVTSSVGPLRDKAHITPQQLAKGLGWFSVALGLAELIAPRKVSKTIGVRGDHDLLIRLLGARELMAAVGILSRPRPASGVWSRVAGDVMDLACLGAAMTTTRSSRNRLLITTAAVAGITALDYINAKQLTRDKDDAATRTRSITINRPVDVVYRFWRNFENLPRFMKHLEAVHVITEDRSHWVVNAPMGRQVEWDADIIEDIPNELIAWQSLPGADVENSGHVRFKAAPGERGTEVHVDLTYNPPGGVFGVGVAKLLGSDPGQQIKGDLYRLKQVLETGEVVQSDASIHKGPHPAHPPSENGESDSAPRRMLQTLQRKLSIV